MNKFLVIALIFAGNCLYSVEDPYVWLEKSDSADTQQWLKDQREKFEEYMQKSTVHSAIEERLVEVWQYDRYTVPKRVGNRLFFLAKAASQEYERLYVQEGIQGTPKLLFDPQAITTDTIMTIAHFCPSPDGQSVAIGFMQNGSDCLIWKVMDIDTAEFHADAVPRINFAEVVWSPDCLGFYCSKFDTQGRAAVYYHALHTKADDDLLVYEDKDHPDRIPAPLLSHDGRYLLITTRIGCQAKSGFLIKDLSQKESPITELLAPGHAKYIYLHNEQTKLFFLTDENAPLGKIITLDLLLKTSQTFLPEGNFPLMAFVPVGSKFVAAYLEDGYGTLKVLDGHGTYLHTIPLPDKGTIFDPNDNLLLVGSPKHQELLFGFTNFIQPTKIYCYHIESKELQCIKEPKTNFSPDDYRVSQIFYPSKDGTKIPLSIVHKKNLPIDGKVPTLLYGYGGFGVSILPKFDPTKLVWADRGGIFSIANIRGGEEYGKKWHDAAMLHNKQTCFDDFIAAAEWLIANGITDAPHLAIKGRSNGGLLVAACMIQRPELFGVVSVECGVLDMLRFHLFTVGWAWMVEYGNPEDPTDFATLYRYSPYHNLQRGVNYPATLVSTAEFDDRVVPLHSYKFTAALQAANGGSRPVLLQLETKAGHGRGRTTSQMINECANIYTFILEQLEANGRSS